MFARLLHLLATRERPRVLRPMLLGAEGRDEAWLRDFLLANPEALPSDDFDPAFAHPIPVCRELQTRAGRIDGLFVNRDGALILVECKLWRNPEARREVIAQILDYAKEVASWHYEDFQREVSRATGRRGENVPYQMVLERHPDVREADFVDAVSRNLAAGRFLLVIVGDGIREGTETIARYVTNHLGLRFTLGLVEMAAYELSGDEVLLQPRILARTVNIERGVVRIEAAGGAVALLEPDEEPDEAVSSNAGRGRPFSDDQKRVDRDFWVSFRNQLTLDDPSQPGPVTGYGRARLDIVPGLAWLNVYSARSNNRIGVGCILKGEQGGVLFKALMAQRDEIERELANIGGTEPVSWGPANVGHAVYVERQNPGEWSPEFEAANMAWLLRAANVAVNVFRPRLLELARSNDA